MPSFERFLVPYDFSADSKAALELASDLARRVGAEIQVLHIVVPIVLSVPAVGPNLMPALGVPVDLPRDAQRSLDEVLQPLAAAGLRIHAVVVESSSIAETIRRYAEKLDASMIVMGTHGRSGLARILLGSVTERTIRQPPCPVLLTSAAAAESAAK